MYIIEKIFGRLPKLVAAFVSFFVVFLGASFPQDKNDLILPTDLFFQAVSAYESGFYPGVVKYAGEFQERFPASPFLPELCVYHGESLYRLGLKEQAKEKLFFAESFFSDGTKGSKESVVHGKANYWLGRIAYDKADYEQSVILFNQAATLLRDQKADPKAELLYYDSLLRLSISCLDSGNSNCAVPVLEFLWEAPLPKEDSAKVRMLLFRAYKESDLPEKITNAFVLLEADDVPQGAFDTISLYAAESYAQQEKYSESYEIFSRLVDEAGADVAAVALKGAWSIADQLPSVDYGKIMAVVENKFTEYPLLLAEFWSRMGLDEFYSGGLDEARVFFEKSCRVLEEQKCIREENFNEIFSVNISFLAEIDFIRAGRTKTAAQQAYEKLSSSCSENVLSKSVFPLLARYASLAEEWDSAVFYGGQALYNAECAYWTALAAFRLGRPEQCAEILENHVLSKDMSRVVPGLGRTACVLYADSLFACGKVKESMAVFAELDKANALDSQSYLNYSVVALQSGYDQLAYEAALKSQEKDALYLAELALFKLQDWRGAQMKGVEYLSHGGEFDSFASFFLGLSLYRQGKFEESYKVLNDFRLSNPFNVFARSSQKTSVVCALQLHQQTGRKESVWLDNALELAEDLVATAPSQQEKESSVLMAVQIYSDAQQFDKALNLLKPYLNQQDEFAAKCKYHGANLLALAGDYEGADLLFAKVEKYEFDKTLAETCSYRRGEIFYSANEFEKAAERFASYRRTYPFGMYGDCALYFNGDSLKRIGNLDGAILCHESLVAMHPESSFVFGSVLELVGLYRKKGEYQNALDMANVLLQDYKQQAVLTGMEEEVLELELLVQGAQEKMAKAMAAYELAGGIETPEGRNAGVELGEIFLGSPYRAEEGVALLQQILSSMEGSASKEPGVFAKAAMLLGGRFWDLGEFDQAANLFLQAADSFLLVDLENAALAMCRAAESFGMGGKFSDAKFVADNMLQLFPDSPWTLASSKWR